MQEKKKKKNWKVGRGWGQGYTSTFSKKSNWHAQAIHTFYVGGCLLEISPKFVWSWKHLIRWTAKNNMVVSILYTYTMSTKLPPEMRMSPSVRTLWQKNKNYPLKWGCPFQWFLQWRHTYTIQQIHSTYHLPCSGTCSQTDSPHQKGTSSTGRDPSTSTVVQEAPHPASYI